MKKLLARILASVIFLVLSFPVGLYIFVKQVIRGLILIWTDRPLTSPRGSGGTSRTAGQDRSDTGPAPKPTEPTIAKEQDIDWGHVAICDPTKTGTA